jgi:predicted outer membrane lipoprotein
MYFIYKGHIAVVLLACANIHGLISAHCVRGFFKNCNDSVYLLYPQIDAQERRISYSVSKFPFLAVQIFPYCFEAKETFLLINLMKCDLRRMLNSKGSLDCAFGIFNAMFKLFEE